MLVIWAVDQKGPECMACVSGTFLGPGQFGLSCFDVLQIIMQSENTLTGKYAIEHLQ